MPPVPLPDPPTNLEGLRRSCTRLQMRSVQRRMDLQTALAAADADLQRVQRGTGELRVHGMRKARSKQAAQEVTALIKVVNACARNPASAGPLLSKSGNI